MKRGIAVLALLGTLAAVGYFTAAKWAIRHEEMTFYDTVRNNRPVAVDIAIRRDKEMQAPTFSPLGVIWRSAFSTTCRLTRRW
jgi:hypothetical protein